MYITNCAERFQTVPDIRTNIGKLRGITTNLQKRGRDIMKLNDTIAAIATPRGAGGIAIIRISGTHAIEIASKIVFPLGKIPLEKCEDRKLTLCRIQEPSGGGYMIDRTLAVVMRAPKTYTGEDVVAHCLIGFGRINLFGIVRRRRNVTCKSKNSFAYSVYLFGDTAAERHRRVMQSCLRR